MPQRLSNGQTHTHTHKQDSVCKQAVSALQDIAASTDIQIPLLVLLSPLCLSPPLTPSLFPPSFAPLLRIRDWWRGIQASQPCLLFIHAPKAQEERERDREEEAGKESKRSASWVPEAPHFFVIVSVSFSFFLGGGKD